jgi:hypothetical protein
LFVITGTTSATSKSADFFFCRGKKNYPVINITSDLTQSENLDGTFKET